MRPGRRAADRGEYSNGPSGPVPTNRGPDCALTTAGVANVRHSVAAKGNTLDHQRRPFIPFLQISPVHHRPRIIQISLRPSAAFRWPPRLWRTSSMRGLLRPVHPTASVGRSETPNFLKSIHNLARSSPTKFGTLHHCFGAAARGGKERRRWRRTRIFDYIS
ncbi:MAG: hypothetical protein IANPNBLG_04734 [Bryobacteraceae bacterium]|nr:hypothetical protein [Bryobacteraceae bacterium]